MKSAFLFSVITSAILGSLYFNYLEGSQTARSKAQATETDYFRLDNQGGVSCSKNPLPAAANSSSEPENMQAPVSCHEATRKDALLSE